MVSNRVKLFLATIMILPVLALTIFNTNGAGAVSQTAQDAAQSQDAAKSQDTDVSALYKSKCAACHTAKAEKWFETSKMDEALIEIVLKGKKAEKPPHMPAFEGKGVSPDQAKLLVAYMRQIRTPSKE